jgi:hypothetical protein
MAGLAAVAARAGDVVAALAVVSDASILNPEARARTIGLVTRIAVAVAI